MANYYGAARTNYFTVRDANAFQAWADKRGFRVITDKDGEVGILPGDASDDGTLNTWGEDSETGDFEKVDILGEIASHLVKGSVAILMESGAEKLRYIVGRAEAINSDGKRREITLEQIYKQAAKLGTSVTQCEY